MNRYWTILLAAAVALFGCGLGSGGLTRDKAVELIDQELDENRGDYLKETFANCIPGSRYNMERTYALDRELVARGYAFKEEGSKPNVLVVSEKGESLLQRKPVGFGQYQFFYRTPPTIDLEITGLVEVEPTMVKVEFQWQYADLPTDWTGIHLAGGTGKAVVAKYDDGWRLKPTSHRFMEEEKRVNLIVDEDRCLGAVTN